MKLFICILSILGKMMVMLMLIVLSLRMLTMLNYDAREVDAGEA